MESAMSLKRSFHGDDGLGVFVQESKRRHMLKNSVVDVMKAISSDEIVVRMEPIIRKVVREEVERVIRACLHPNARPSFSQVETSARRGFQLLFVGKLPSPIFTGSRIEAEDGGPVMIQLVDANTKAVEKNEPYSSIKVEIVVLDGDFCSDENEDWSENEFKAKVIREREGKRPLVTGGLNVTLREGVATLGDIVFTDNSSWMRCRKFRLGARVLLQRSCGDVRIKEGRSEAFVVKDHRGELYKKHYPPSLDDEIWRLEKIAKEGAFRERLAANGVKTVGDFLRMHTTNPTLLRSMLGGPTRTWDTIVEHASTCVINDDKYHVYYGNADGVALLLNPIYQVAAATFDGKNYLSLDKLTFTQKLAVEKTKKHAYENVNDFVPIDARTILGPSRSLTDVQVEPFNSPTSILQHHHEFPIAQQEMQLDFNHTSASTSFAYEDSHQFQLSLAQNTPPIQVFNPAFKNSFSMAEIFSTPYNEENSWSSGGSQGQIASTSNLATDQMSTWPSVNGIWGQGNGFFFSASNDSELGIVSSVPDFSVNISRTGERNAAARFRAVIMCILFWRNLARRKARPFYLNHY